MFPDTVVSVSKNVPCGIHGLLPAFFIRGLRHNEILSRFRNLPDVLPLSPRIRFIRSNKLGRMPVSTAIRGDVYPLNTVFAGIGSAKNSNRSRGRVLVPDRLGDNRF